MPGHYIRPDRRFKRLIPPTGGLVLAALRRE